MRPATNVAATVLVAIPFVMFLYPAVALLTARSGVPVYLNRYSETLAVFNLLSLSIYCAFVWGALTGRLALQLAALISVIGASFVTLSSNVLLGLPAIAIAAQATRLSAGISLIVMSQLFDRQRRNAFAGICLLLGALIGLTAVIDLSWSAIAASTDKARQLDRQYRVAYDLDRVSDRDIVLVGDSFVWGQGVSVEHRFGDVLERSMQRVGSAVRVYSLGLVGVSLPGYLQQLQDVPAHRQAGHVIVAFYANDMPPRSNLQDSLQQVAISLGRGSVSLRAAADILRVAVTPSVDGYADLVLSHFDERDGTFPMRWRQLESEMMALFEQARVRSQATPSFLLLPMLTNFENSEFGEPLRRVGQLAERVGFRVVDTMPAFRADGLGALNYRVAPNDLHLNEGGNRIVADVLERLIDNRLAPGEQLSQGRPR